MDRIQTNVVMAIITPIDMITEVSVKSTQLIDNVQGCEEEEGVVIFNELFIVV